MPEGTFDNTGDIFGCHNCGKGRVPPASSEWVTGMLLNTLQGTGRLPQQRNAKANVSVVLRLRNPAFIFLARTSVLYAK